MSGSQCTVFFNIFLILQLLQHDRRFCSSSLSKSGAYMTHSATRLPTVWSEMLVESNVASSSKSRFFFTFSNFLSIQPLMSLQFITFHAAPSGATEGLQLFCPYAVEHISCLFSPAFFGQSARTPFQESGLLSFDLSLPAGSEHFPTESMRI